MERTDCELLRLDELEIGDPTYRLGEFSMPAAINHKITMPNREARLKQPAA